VRPGFVAAKFQGKTRRTKDNAVRIRCGQFEGEGSGIVFGLIAWKFAASEAEGKKFACTPPAFQIEGYCQIDFTRLTVRSQCAVAGKCQGLRL